MNVLPPQVFVGEQRQLPWLLVVRLHYGVSLMPLLLSEQSPVLFEPFSRLVCNGIQHIQRLGILAVTDCIPANAVHEAVGGLHRSHPHNNAVDALHTFQRALSLECEHNEIQSLREVPDKFAAQLLIRQGTRQALDHRNAPFQQPLDVSVD